MLCKFSYKRYMQTYIILLCLLILYYLIKHANEPVKCIVYLEPHNKSDYKNKDAHGVVRFEQTSKGVRVYGTVNGLSPGLHGFHIHESGDLSEGCKSLRGHFNPFQQSHGARVNSDGTININRHLGDLGNIICNETGHGTFDFVDPMLSLNGAYSILGRSVIVHDGEDDLGQTDHPDSKTTGNAGNRALCGIIGRA